MKKKFQYMSYLISLFSAFVGAYLAWYVIGVEKTPLDFLIFLVCFSVISGIITKHLRNKRKIILTDERIEKILDRSARNGFIVFCLGLIIVGVFAPEPFGLLSVIILALGLSAYLISSITYDREGDTE
jgi:uncharacterized membrane protein